LSPAKVTVLASVSPTKSNMIFLNIIFTPFYMDSESIILLNTIAKKYILQVGI